jgi:sulfate permease, SulP family
LQIVDPNGESFVPLATNNWKSIRQDALAGLTGAVAGTPQAMGFALIAGVNPIYGLYTAVVATIVGSFTASSPLMTIAPTNAMALVVFGTLHTDTPNFTIEKLFVLTLLVGVFQLAFGLLRLGDLTRFVSNAVMTGFIAGAGLLIILGQLPYLTGYVRKSDVHGVIPKFIDWVTHIHQWEISTLILGLLTIAIILIFHAIGRRAIATLVAIITVSLLNSVLGGDTVHIVRDIAAIPSGLPHLSIPDAKYIVELLPVALSVAILAVVQGAGIAYSTPNPSQKEPDMDRDFIAQGIANIVGSFFQSMPAGGSLSRSAVNISAGARTRMANIFAGGFIAIILLTLGHTIEHVVLAALAAHLIVAAFSLIKRSRIELVWRVNRSARISMTTTFVATLILPLDYSIYLGVILSLGMYIYSSSQNIEVFMLELTADNHFKEIPVPDRLPDHQPIILSVYGHFYFATVQQLRVLLPKSDQSQRPVVILRLRHNQYMGSTGIRFLCQYARTLREHGGRLILTGVGDEIQQQLARTGATHQLGEENIFTANGTILDATMHALEEAQQWLLTSQTPGDGA